MRTEAEAKPIVFVHVRKCAGTSVRAGLAHAVSGARRSRDVFEVDGDVAMQAVRVSGDTLTNLASKQARFLDGLLPYIVLTTSPRLVLGHFRYRESYDSLLLGKVKFVTVLRHPVDRFVSLYLYRRFHGSRFPLNRSLDDIVREGAWNHLGHHYVDVFAGKDDIDPGSDEAVESAIATLRKFDVVGFIDMLDSFAADVSSVVGVPVNLARRNTTPAPIESRSISDATLAEIARTCAIDTRVYEAIRSEA